MNHVSVCFDSLSCTLGRFVVDLCQCSLISPGGAARAPAAKGVLQAALGSDMAQGWGLGAFEWMEITGNSTRRRSSCAGCEQVFCQHPWGNS